MTRITASVTMKKIININLYTGVGSKSKSTFSNNDYF